MQCSFAFSHSPTGQFLVLLENTAKESSLTAFADENEFIQAVVLSLDDNEMIMQVISHVLLATSGRQSFERWTSLDLPARELDALGLNLAATSSYAMA